jgi:hypothetical protein
MSSTGSGRRERPGGGDTASPSHAKLPAVTTEGVEDDSEAITPSEAPMVVDVPSGDADGRRRRVRRRWMVGAGIAVVVGAAIATVVVISRRGGPDHPSAWDPRVSDLASFVEREKGVDFDHPVNVVYLAEAEFKDRLRIDEELSDSDREDLERAEAMLRALGLQGGSGSLLDQANRLSTEGVAAFYDPDRQEIVIPQSEPDSVASDATLVHELTHALQDQMDQLEDAEGADDSEAEDGRRALIEGEAEHVKAAWTEQLSDDERDDLIAEASQQSDDATADLDDVSTAMLASFAVPYSIGGPMVAAIDHAGRLADAFEDPPRSQADVLNPNRWLAPVEVVSLDAPPLDDDEDALGEADSLGAHTVYLMLASALEPAEALAAADGWAGDRMQTYRTDDDRTCVRVAMIGVDDAATERLDDAIATWVASRPDGSASSTSRDDHIELDACDGGATSELTADRAELPSIRASLVPLLLDAGVSAKLAACMSVEFVDRVPFDLLTADDLAADDQAVVTGLMLDARETCESG